MKKTLISLIVLSACVAFAATSPKVDRVPTIVATGDSNTVMRTVVVSSSPTNEYTVLEASLVPPGQGSTNLSYGITFVATPTVVRAQGPDGLNALASGTLTATPTVSTLVVTNTGTASPTVKFLIYGIKRVGYSQP